MRSLQSLASLLVLAASAFAQSEPVAVTTQTLSQAVAAGARSIRVTQSGVLSDTLRLRDVDLSCDPGVVLTFRLSDKRNAVEVLGNVKITGCAIACDWAGAPLPVPVDADGPHGISLRGVSVFTLSGSLVHGFPGDGIYVGPGISPRVPSSEVGVFKSAFRNNGRQGATVSSGVNVLFEDCIFAGTKGVAPMAGVDVEPADKGDRALNVVFRRCLASLNGGSAYIASLHKLVKDSPAVDILFEDCTADGIPKSHYYLRVENSGSNVTNTAPGIVRLVASGSVLCEWKRAESP